MEEESKYFIIGFITGAILLLVNGLFPYHIAIFSMLSPNGMQFYIGGLRIKHWFIGLILLVIGYFFREDSPKAYFFMGLGSILILDEIPELLQLYCRGWI